MTAGTGNFLQAPGINYRHRWVSLVGHADQRKHMNTQWIAYLCVALLAAVLIPASPAAADGIDGDCRGYDAFGYYIYNPTPDVGAFRLACPTASAECVEDEYGEVCRAGAGVVSIIGAGFCHRPLGPLPPLLAAVCGGALDTAGNVLAFTGCTDTVPIGDHRIIPGGFTRVRQHDDGTIVVAATFDCGQREATCTFKLFPSGTTQQGCS